MDRSICKCKALGGKTVIFTYNLDKINSNGYVIIALLFQNNHYLNKLK